jgi:hypothetical protein
MKKNIRLIKFIFIFWLAFISVFVSFVPTPSAREPIYKAKVNIRLQWSDGGFEEPIVPREEIVTLNITVILEIVTGESFGAGLLQGYTGSPALINLHIVDFPSWCYPTLKYDVLVGNISPRIEAKTQVFLNINENAPAYAQGYITINIKVPDLGWIKGDNQTFTLNFKPAFFPIIKTELPDVNTKEIDPYSKAVFPINVENAGNAKTKVFFEIENLPQGWVGVIQDSAILETSGSKDTIYLTITPPNTIGYHYEEAIITVKITPTFADNISQVGTPIYGYFLVRNRGFSSGGLEFYLIIFVIIMLILAFFVWLSRRKQKSKKI